VSRNSPAPRGFRRHVAPWPVSDRPPFDGGYFTSFVVRTADRTPLPGGGSVPLARPLTSPSVSPCGSPDRRPVLRELRGSLCQSGEGHVGKNWQLTYFCPVIVLVIHRFRSQRGIFQPVKRMFSTGCGDSGIPPCACAAPQRARRPSKGSRGPVKHFEIQFPKRHGKTDQREPFRWMTARRNVAPKEEPRGRDAHSPCATPKEAVVKFLSKARILSILALPLRPLSDRCWQYSPVTQGQERA